MHQIIHRHDACMQAMASNLPLLHPCMMPTCNANILGMQGWHDTWMRHWRIAHRGALEHHAAHKGLEGPSYLSQVNNNAAFKYT